MWLSLLVFDCFYGLLGLFILFVVGCRCSVGGCRCYFLYFNMVVFVVLVCLLGVWVVAGCSGRWRVKVPLYEASRMRYSIRDLRERQKKELWATGFLFFLVLGRKGFLFFLVLGRMGFLFFLRNREPVFLNVTIFWG